jgi:hypothetical protein
VETVDETFTGLRFPNEKHCRIVERFGVWLLTRVVEFQQDLSGTGVRLTPLFPPLFFFVEHTVDLVDDVYQAIGISLHCGLPQGSYQRSSFSPCFSLQGEYLRWRSSTPGEMLFE